MNTLKKLITEIENHTKQKFDINNRRHFFILNEKINRLNKKEVTQLNVIKKIIADTNNCNDIFNNKTQYTRNK